MTCNLESVVVTWKERYFIVNIFSYEKSAIHFQNYEPKIMNVLY